MTEEYRPITEIKKLIEDNFPIYWVKVFNILNEDEIITQNGIRIKKDNKDEIKQLKKLLAKWEAEIQGYRDEAVKYFDLDFFDENNDEVYLFPEFKDIFAERLWTVKSALRTKNPDLDKFKSDFKRTPAADIFVTVKNILKGADNYMRYTAPALKLNRINAIEQLKLDFLSEENMLLSGVIGLGIRSEILHRLYPSHFAIMTRKSGWGMYYLTRECDEFVIDEQDDGKYRTQFYWEYEYERFSFYSNFLCNLIDAAFAKHNFKMQPHLRFGYANIFLSLISDEHKDQIDYLNTWRLVEV